MEVKIENGYIVVKLPVNPTPIPSATGKTLLIATSHGNKATTATVNGKPVVVGFTAYIGR